MLNQPFYDVINSGFHIAINLLGTQGDYHCVKDPTRDKTGLTMGFAGGTSDSTLVQSFGVESKTITVKVEDFSQPPEKFDQFVINGQRHVAESVHLVHLNGRVIGYKIRTKGK